MPKGKVHKLSLFQKKKALKLYSEGMSLAEIGRRYNVSKGTIRYWLKKYTYRKTPYRFVPAKTYNDLLSHCRKIEMLYAVSSQFIEGLGLSHKDKYVFMDDFYDHHIYGNEDDSPQYSLHVLCEVMQIDRITYKHHLEARDNYRKQEARTAKLMDMINESYHQSKGIYGAEQIKHDLERKGAEISVPHVRALMHQMNIGRGKQNYGLKQRLFYYPERKCNLLLRRFKVTGINQLWVADFKEFGFHGHRYYLCAVMDVYSRHVLAAIIRETKGKYLAAATLRRAIAYRKTSPQILHTDGGGEFDAKNMRKVYKEYKIQHSFSRPGVPQDNPFIESFFNLFLNKFLYAGEYFRSLEELKRKFGEFIDYCNHLLRRSLNNQSPIEYEAQSPHEALYIHPGQTKENKEGFMISTQKKITTEKSIIDVYADTEL